MDNLYSSVSKGGCYDTNHYGPRPLPLLKLNYLSEYLTEAEKELVRKNLGIHNDSLVEDFIIHNKFLLGLIPGHEDSLKIGTIYDAICYLFGDVDAENERILELEAEALILNKLVGSKAVPYEFDKNDKKVYLWPELKDIEEGYLYELNSSIQEAFNNIEDVRNSIGTLPDGSDVELYILDKHNELLKIIGEYKETFEDFEEIEGFTGNYAENNTSVKAAINDLDYRLAIAESLFSNDASLISDRVKYYNELLDNTDKRVKEASSKIIELKNNINSTKELLLEKLGENDSENPTGIYASLKTYNDTLTSDLNDFKSKVDSDLADVKEEVAGIQGTVELAVELIVELIVELCKEDLVEKKDELIGVPATEEYAATGIYEIIDNLTISALNSITSKSEKTLQEIGNASANIEGLVSDVNRLINGDEEAGVESLEKRTEDIKEQITKANTLITEANTLIEDANTLIEEGGFENYYTKAETDSLVNEFLEGVSIINTIVPELSGLCYYNGMLYGVSDSVRERQSGIYEINPINLESKKIIDIPYDLEGITCSPDGVFYVCTEDSYDDKNLRTEGPEEEGTHIFSVLKVNLFTKEKSFEVIGKIEIDESNQNKGFEGIAYYGTEDGKPVLLIGNLKNPTKLILWTPGPDIVGTIKAGVNLNPEITSEIADLVWKDYYLYILDSKTAEVHKCTLQVEGSNLVINKLSTTNYANAPVDMHKHLGEVWNDGDGENPEALAITDDAVYIGCDTTGRIYKISKGFKQEVSENINTKLKESINIINNEKESHQLKIEILTELPKSPKSDTFYFIKQS